MITIFAVLKPMTDPFDRIQRNAVMSWLKLTPTPEVILFGDRDGVPELAKELGVKHVKKIARTDAGNDRMDDALTKAWKAAKYPLCMYINADIILPPNFLDVVSAIDAATHMMIGRRQNTPIDFAIDFDDPAWFQAVETAARQRGHDAGVVSVDYFVHRRNAFDTLPVMAAGSYFSDNYLIGRALDARIPVIDASEVVFAVHQDHPTLLTEARHELPEAVALREQLTRGAVNIAHATHRLRKPV